MSKFRIVTRGEEYRVETQGDSIEWRPALMSPTSSLQHARQIMAKLQREAQPWRVVEYGDD